MVNSLHAERGAVNILFLVVVLVVALAFVALWFTQLQDNEELAIAAQKAKAESSFYKKTIQYQQDWYAQFAKFIGSGVPATMIIDDDDIRQSRPVPDITAPIVESLNRELNSVESLAQTPGARPTTLHEAWDVFAARQRQLEADVTTQKDNVNTKQSEVDQLNTTIATNATRFSDTLQTTNREKDAEIQRLTAQIDRLRAENDVLQGRIREAQDTTETVRREEQATRIDLANKTKKFESQVSGIRGERTLQRRQEKPDGRVVAVDNRRGIAFIDIGSRDQLHAGLRFKVYEDVKGGDKVVKGYLRVTSVSANMAEARIEDGTYGSAGIEKGDWITNPVFRADGSKVRFTFLGQLPGRYNRETAEMILKEQGAQVDQAVSVETDFLVFGKNESEDALPLNESPEYVNAVRWGITIITEKDLIPFLRR